MWRYNHVNFYTCDEQLTISCLFSNHVNLHENYCNGKGKIMLSKERDVYRRLCYGEN